MLCHDKIERFHQVPQSGLYHTMPLPKARKLYNPGLHSPNPHIISRVLLMRAAWDP